MVAHRIISAPGPVPYRPSVVTSTYGNVCLYMFVNNLQFRSFVAAVPLSFYQEEQFFKHMYTK